MPVITNVGIGSGQNYESIIQGLVNAERTPINLLDKRTSGLKTQLSAFGKLQSSLSSMRDAAAKLATPELWNTLGASSSDATAVTATATSSGAAGSYNVTVNRLAAAQNIASAAVASGSSLGTGTLTIELGQWNADQSGFTPKSGSSAVSINIGAGQDSLSSVRDKINAAGAGVLASVVNDASGSRLVLRSATTGESQGFRVSVADDDGTNNDASGLSALAFDPSQGISQATQTQRATNAEAIINGLTISAETNQLSNAIDGLSFTLLKPATATISVKQDQDTVKKAVSDFIAAYNANIQLLRDQTKYDEGSKTAGPLQGDSTAITLQGALRAITSGNTTLASTYNRLSTIGVDIKADGTLSLNDSKLNTALGNMADVKQLFMGVDSANPNNSGLATRWRTFADQALGFDGALASRQKGLQGRIDSNDKQRSNMEDRIALVEKRLRAQYNTLDKNMGQLTGLQSYVAQQMQMLSNKG
ncbi:flagellar filament capping protein FliD [Roseateles sp. BYS180W]|uniref:Flagellar hook-associated protein 2 n=1 Tax=Roseateles rivi TaxID=3299028 RepID=A0ABW7FV13_9BURK